MAYTKKTWTTSSKVSAEALNHLETQYDEVMATSTTWNNHDSRYYLKTTAIAKFFSASFMGSGSGSDADLIDGHHVSDLLGTGLPVGAIVWWSKDSGLIPTGWHLCNGAAGTTDYRDRFVIGVSTTYTVKNLYGLATVTPTTYAVSIGGTAIDYTQIPSHTHSWSEVHCVFQSTYSYSSFGYPRSFYRYNTTQSAKTTDIAGGSQAHNHNTGSSVTWNSEANLPPYVALYLIQRLS